jgi:hypothetical protein
MSPSPNDYRNRQRSRRLERLTVLISSILCLNSCVEQVRLPVIPDQCRMGHAWRPGTVELLWLPCGCSKAKARRGGHITIRCLAGLSGGRCAEEWISPLHDEVSLRESHKQRPGYR